MEFGDFFDGSDELDRLRIQTYSKSLEKIGYDAICVTASSFSLGDKFLRGIMKTSSVPFVSLNAKDKKTDRFLDQPFVIKSSGRFWTAVVGLTGPQEVGHGREHAPGLHHADPGPDPPEKFVADLPEETVDFLDPEKVLREYLPLIKNQADLIVLFSSLSQEQNEEIAYRFPDIGVIVGGNSEVEEKVINSTVIVNNTSTDGKKMGRITLTLDDEGILVKHKVEWLPVRKTYAEDMQLRRLLNDFYETVANDSTLWHGVRPRLTSFELEKDRTNEYVGAAKCLPCHKEIHAAWRKSRHANAYNTLVEANRYFYPDCVSCHTTGAGFSSGFKVGRSTRHLEGVQCEVCHGPGKKHVASEGEFPLRNTISEELCIECHTGDISPQFRDGFAQLVAAVNHSQVPKDSDADQEPIAEKKPRTFQNLRELRTENTELFMKLYEGLSAGCRSDHLLFECKGKTAAAMRSYLDQVVETDKNFESIMTKMVERFGEKVKTNERQKATFRLRQQSVADALSEAVREKGKASLDLFVMSYCPYGIRAENLVYQLEEETFKEKIELRLHFIASGIEQEDSETGTGDADASTAFKALHGPKEIDENMRQALIQKYHSEKLKQYLLLRNRSINSTDWKECAREAGIEPADIERRIENGEGAELLAEHVELVSSKGITASPTLLINGQRFLGKFKR